MLTKKQIESNKEKIKGLLRSTKREGIEKVIEYLENTDFFIVPSSLKRHHNWEGGLAQHCLGVYDRLLETGKSLPSDSVIITSLLHDICKARKHYKNNKGEWVERSDSQLYIPGHGSRSVKLLQKTCELKLTEDERKAIRWHMGGYNVPKEDLKDYFSTKKSDLCRLLYNADCYDARHNGN